MLEIVALADEEDDEAEAVWAVEVEEPFEEASEGAETGFAGEVSMMSGGQNDMRTDMSIDISMSSPPIRTGTSAMAVAECAGEDSSAAGVVEGSAWRDASRRPRRVPTH